MIRTSIRLIGITGLAAAFASSATGQESLMDIYQRALQSDPLVREAEAAYLATSEARPQARSSLLPSLALSSGVSASSSEDPNPATNFATLEPTDVVSTDTNRDTSSWSISLDQTVFDWGNIVSLRQADKIVLRAETDYESARQTLLVRVSDAYFNVLAAESALASETAAREALSRQLEQAQRRFDVGLIAITDVQEAQAGYDLAVATEIAAQQVLASARESLRAIIGEPVVNLAGPSEELPLETPEPNNAEEWVETALQQNLTLVSSRIGADIAQDTIDIQRASRLPTLSFSSSYSESTTDTLRTNRFANGNVEPVSSMSGPEGYSWSLNVTVPLYTGGFNASRIQQSVYEHRGALEALERVARETERQTRDAYLRVLSDISRVRALRQAVQSSRTALQATEAGFEVGTRTTVDVLTSQNVVSQAETNYARSRFDYILNVLRLKQAAGSLSVADIEQVDQWLEQ